MNANAFFHKFRASEKKVSTPSSNISDGVDKLASGITSHSDSFYSCASQDMGKLTESLEQLNKALSSITDEAETAETGVITPLPPMRANSMSKFFVFFMCLREIKMSQILHFINLYFKFSVLNSSGIKPIAQQAVFKGSTASLPSSLTPKSRSPTAPIKCPNVLIYCDNTEVYESIKSLMRQTLKKYR
jgi:hypothetical protein